MSRIVRSASVILVACSMVVASNNAAQADASRKAECHRMLADIYDRQGKVNDAMLEYNALSVMTPTDAEAHFTFGKFLLRQKQYKLAEAQFRKATSIDGSRADYWANLGNSLLMLRSYPAAIEALRRGGPQCAPLLQQAQQYQSQLQAVDQYNKNVKKQQQQQQE